ncbi:mechanosensitive channel MscK [Pseudomonas sp. UL073]|uniref:Mechanosensitive channel MscK n=1 Tax=Zestomonas insulae TaxID=2809017 RepID=A0ABS2IDI6_9GAMM|nr:mechanosensitive channel MscK [Pseudomonas insulae]MBM7061164.1 mechanosensitive channel MscK [Pseudomonas insulae]
MPLLRTFFAAALLSLGLALQPLHAADAPNRDEVQRSLDSLAERKLPDAEAQPLKQVLEKTLALLDERDASSKALTQLRQQLAGAPRQVLESQRELARLNNSPASDPAKRFAGNTVAQLDQQLADRNNQLAEWQQELAAANSLIVTAQTRPERAQAEISDSQTRTQQINSILKLGKEQGKPLSNDQRAQLNAELAALAAKMQLRREELAGNSLLQDLGNARHDLLEERIRRAEQESLVLQSLINDQRRAQSERTVAELSREAQKTGGDNFLAVQSETNLKLSDYLLRSTERLNQLTRKNLETKQQLDNLNQVDQALDEQISVLQGSLLLAKILYQQKQALPTIKVDRDLADEIADIRLYQFEINQQREQLSNPKELVDEILAKQPPEQVTAEMRSTLNDLIATRSDLLERLNREMSALLNESITLQLNQKQLQGTAQTLRKTLDEQMFWIPSNKPIDWAWLKGAKRMFEQQLSSVAWGSAVKQLGAGLIDRPLVFLPLLLVIGVLLWRRRYLMQKLTSLHQDIGHYKHDSQLHTPMALLFNLLLALPGTMLLGLAGFALQADARGQNVALGAALIEMARAWLMFYTAYRVLAPSGVAELHFHWPRPQVAFLRTQVRRFGAVVMALVAVVTFAEHQPDSLADDIIGIAVVLTCYTLMTWLMAKLLLDPPTRERASAFRLLLGLAFTALPVALFIAVGAGYYYTALKLSDRLIDTLYLLMLWLVIEATLVRGLSVAARRLAYQRALAKRQAQVKDGGDGEVVEEPTLDIEQVNQQSLRLISLALLAAFIVSLYWVWADLISVFAYLDNITLYQYTSGTGAAATQVPLSLAGLLGALVILGITVALARNLPGLLEVLVLSRLSLAQGSAYATTTLLSYVIIGFGTVSTLSTLGVSWDKLQWLAAALSVGIGFGLQAIFANFVSGLIILFERPMRIGDVVTIGALSGTVSKIRIRATTITDFDRKEIIVPNQNFITDQLINWSLTDTVTRVTIKIGLAYETDLPLARKLMMQACLENARVLRDPEPLLYFLNVSASTFDHELRFHVRELGDRNSATDEILNKIIEAFRIHGVEMAFNQVDVFVKNLQGQEAVLESTPPRPAPTQDAKPR